MSRKAMAGRIALLLAAAGTGLLAAGCSEEYPQAATEDATADSWETDSLENEPSPQGEISGELQIAGPEGASFLSYRASCPDGMHYQVEIWDEVGGVLQELSYNIPEDLVEIRNGGDGSWLYTDSLAHSEDVNGDGSEDLWLYLGTVGAGGYSFWACYAYDEEKQQFDRVEGFEQLMDPFVDRDGVIGSVHCAGVSEVFWEKYSIRGSRLIPLGKLAGYCMDGQGILYLYDEEIYENGVSVESRSGLLSTEVVNTELWESQLKEISRQVIAAICKNMQPSELAELSYGETIYGDWDEDGLQDVTYTLIVEDPLWPPEHGCIRRQTHYGSGDISYVEQDGKSGLNSLAGQSDF